MSHSQQSPGSPYLAGSLGRVLRDGRLRTHAGAHAEAVLAKPRVRASLRRLAARPDAVQWGPRAVATPALALLTRPAGRAAPWRAGHGPRGSAVGWSAAWSAPRGGGGGGPKQTPLPVSLALPLRRPVECVWNARRAWFSNRDGMFPKYLGKTNEFVGRIYFIFRTIYKLYHVSSNIHKFS